MFNESKWITLSLSFVFVSVLVLLCVEAVTEPKTVALLILCASMKTEKQANMRKIFGKLREFHSNIIIFELIDRVCTHFCCLCFWLLKWIIYEGDGTQRMLWYYYKHRKHLIKFSFFLIMHTILLFPVFRLLRSYSGGWRKGDETRAVFESVFHDYYTTEWTGN